MTDDERTTDDRPATVADRSRDESAGFRLFTCAFCGWQSAAGTAEESFSHLETHLDGIAPDVAAGTRSG